MQKGFEVEGIAIARYKGNSSQQMGQYGRVPVRESVLLWRKHEKSLSRTTQPGSNSSRNCSV